MTLNEQINACEKYKRYLEEKERLLTLLKQEEDNLFLKDFVSIDRRNIEEISPEKMLQRAFLTSVNPNVSSGLMVYINDIIRTDASLSDGRPTLVSYDNGYEELEAYKKGLNIYSLYSDLETNRPILINVDNIRDFKDENYVIEHPDYYPVKESYEYHSKSLEKVSKGSFTKLYDEMQVYYFNLLLDKSRDEAFQRVLYKYSK